MSPALPVPAANDVVRHVAIERGLQAKLSALFADEGSPAAVVARAWNSLLLAGVAQVDEASSGATIQAETVVQVDVEVVGDNELIVIADERRIPVDVGDDHLQMTLWQAFDKLRALVRERGAESAPAD